MPTCTPEAVLATGATFQQTDDGGNRLARVGQLWVQNGSTGTAATLLASGATLQSLSPQQLMLCLVGALWTASGTGKTVAQLLTQSEIYQQASPGGQALCESISEWVTNGSPGTFNAVLATGAKFQDLAALQMLIVELVLVCKIYGITISASGLTTTATNAGFGKCDMGQLTLIAANLYCQLS